MHLLKNPGLHAPDIETSWAGKIRISKKIETTYGRMGTGKEVTYFPDLGVSALTFCTASQISDGSPPESGETDLGFAKGPWTLVCLIPKGNLPNDFHIESALLGSGIIISMAPYIAEHKDHKYELFVAQSCVELLSTRLQGFILDINHDPFAPAEDDVRIHGTVEAKRRARVNSLANSVEAIREGWGRGPEECYRNAVVKAGLETALERAILEWDIQVSHWHTCLKVHLLMSPRKPIRMFLMVSRKTSCSLA